MFAEKRRRSKENIVFSFGPKAVVGRWGVGGDEVIHFADTFGCLHGPGFTAMASIHDHVSMRLNDRGAWLIFSR